MSAMAKVRSRRVQADDLPRHVNAANFIVQ